MQSSWPEQVRKTMAELSTSFPESIRYDVSLDTTLAITAGIDEIIETLFIALALVILVVFIFIQDWRAALIPTIAIPVSLVGAFIVFPMIGFTINVLSLLGLVLAIGIVVDDAIVVVEAVQVKIEEGMDPRSGHRGGHEGSHRTGDRHHPGAGGGVYPGGRHGGHHRKALPAVCHYGGRLGGVLLDQRLDPESGPVFPAAQETESIPRAARAVFSAGSTRPSTRSTDGYMKLTDYRHPQNYPGPCLYRDGDRSALGYLGSILPGGFMPEEDMGYLMVNIQLPDAASLQRSDAVARKVEKIIAKYEEVEYITTATGFSLISGSMSSNAGFIFVSLKDWSEREKTANEIVALLNKDFRAAINEAQVFAFGPPAIPGLGNGSGFTILIQDQGGNTAEYLAEQTANFIQAAMERPEIGSMFTTFRADVPQRYMEINIDKVLKAGVALNDIYTTIGAFLGGAYVNDFNRFGRLYKAYIQAEPEYRLSEDKVNLFFVNNRDGAQCAPGGLCQHQGYFRPRFHQPFQPLPIRRADRRPGPRLHVGPGLDRPGRGGRRGFARGYGLRLEQHVLPGKKGLRHRRDCVCVFPAVRLSDPRRPVRKLVTALEHPAGNALCHLRRVSGAVSGADVQPELRTQCVCPDCPGDADRHGGQKCHSDRRICQAGIRQGAFPVRCRHKSGQAAVPADPDDRLFLHFGRVAAGGRHRRRGRGPGDHGHGLAGGDDPGNRAGGFLLPDAVCLHRQDRPVRAKKRCAQKSRSRWTR